MRIPFLSRKSFFSPEENAQVVAAIQQAEKQTSGEIRVYVESRCRFVNPLDRAVEVFRFLHMDKTKDQNAVLVYVAMKDRQLAVLGDRHIHEKVGTEFWEKQVKEMLSHFGKENYASGLEKIILQIGQALQSHFPYDGDKDENELPDDIVTGR